MNMTPILVAIKGAISSAASPVSVYFTNVPQNAAPPFVRWEVLNSSEDPDLRVYRSLDEGEAVTVNINVWAVTMEAAAAISDSITSALVGAVIVPTGYKQTGKPRRESSQPLDDVESGLFRMMSRWNMRFCKP
jgi:hypothetical protein